MRFFMYLISVVFLINSIILIFRQSFTLGLAIMLAISFSAFVLGHFFDFFISITQSGVGLCFKYLIICGIMFYISLSAYVLSFARNTAQYNESAVIVLGCGLNSDSSPSSTLKNRLDACVEYYKKNPQAIIVVSGGHSRNSEITEADAMEKYLLACKIPSSQIIKESRASTTRENFSYSLELLRQNKIKTDRVAFVTNSFHIYRAVCYAKAAGINNISAVAAPCDWAVFIPAVLRETAGVAAMKFFNY